MNLIQNYLEQQETKRLQNRIFSFLENFKVGSLPSGNCIRKLRVAKPLAVFATIFSLPFHWANEGLESLEQKNPWPAEAKQGDVFYRSREGVKRAFVTARLFAIPQKPEAVFSAAPAVLRLFLIINAAMSLLWAGITRGLVQPSLVYIQWLPLCREK